MKIAMILVVLLFLSVSWPSAAAQSQDPPDASELKLRIVKRDYRDVSDIDRWEIEAAYPEVRLDGDKPAVAFNSAAKSLVMAEVARFKKDMAVRTDAGELPPEDVNYYQSISYKAEYFSADLVSIRFFQSEYTGGAHPNHKTLTLNYDISGDRQLELPGLFTPGSDYLNLISASVNVSLHTQMGKNADDEWILNGTGSKLENYSSWNITKEGLLFTFDPYQVGPYAAGSFEAVVPFENFPAATRGDAFRIAESASYIDGSPAKFCRSGRWTVLDTEYKLASVKGRKNTRAYFYGDEGSCPFGKDCKHGAYVVAGDELIVQREYGDFSCVWYQPAKGSETVGWVRSDQIETRVDPSRPPRSWVGDWNHASNQIMIKQSPSEKLHVYGTAIWQGMGDNVHIGEIDYLDFPDVDVLRVGDGPGKYDCRVRLRRLGRYLLVDDNLQCGGVNVSFNGVYVKK
ncbi:MAG: DUF3298 and DUF4163 domain-containing protein [Acidobacteriota bacterium]|nr:DUF3298 and DUF4163 domain-containing protein [Acidobacteriota bacterium]